MSDISHTQHSQLDLREPPPVAADYLAEVDLEHARWSEITALVGLLNREERLVPGYFRDPDWTAKDLLAHLGAWLTEAAIQLTNIAANSYEPRDLDVDARNVETLSELRDEPWETVWGHAGIARAYMLEHWFSLRVRSEAADQWVRKAGAEHYGEHLPRLRSWVAELVEIRNRPPSDEWDS